MDISWSVGPLSQTNTKGFPVFLSCSRTEREEMFDIKCGCDTSDTWIDIPAMLFSRFHRKHEMRGFCVRFSGWTPYSTSATWMLDRFISILGVLHTKPPNLYNPYGPYRDWWSRWPNGEAGGQNMSQATARFQLRLHRVPLSDQGTFVDLGNVQEMALMKGPSVRAMRS